MRYFLFIIILSGFTLPLRSQSPSAGKLEVENNDYDFGEITQAHGEVSHTFTIKNTGTQPFVINDVRSTCECTDPSWTREPVAPGKQGEVTLHFDPKGYVGPFHKTIQISSTAKNTNMFLTIHGVVLTPDEDEKLEYNIGDLHLQSKHLNLGYVFKGELAEKSMVIKNQGNHPLELVLENVPSYIDAFVKPKVLKPGEFGRIEVYLHSDKTDEWDVIMKKIDVVINNKKDEDAKLAITANIREDFSKLTPDQLANAPEAVFLTNTVNFDTLKNKKPVNCKFLLENRGNSNLIVRAVIPSCGCTAAKPDKLVLKPGDHAYIQAVFNPKGWDSNINKAITVITNDPKNYKQYLWIKGFVE